MQAIQLQQFGGPEVLQIRDIPRPVAGEGELLVRVYAAGINPVDTGVRSGGAAALAAAVPPYVPGFDISGTVAAIGTDVTGSSGLISGVLVSGLDFDSASGRPATL